MNQKKISTFSVKNLSKTYQKRQIVKNVSFTVKSGQAVSLLGPNGAGKTTCFYMATGLIPPDEGEIFLDGYNVTNFPMYRLARLGIGYLPQEASIFRDLSVENNILAVLELIEKDKIQRQKKCTQLLEEFKIEHLRKSPALALSGGERRRLEIARALATEPKFILLDEPFAGVDPVAVKDIRQLVSHITKRNIGVLITDHNVRETLSLVQYTYILYEGSVLTHGTPEKIVRDPLVKNCYLGEDFVF